MEQYNILEDDKGKRGKFASSIQNDKFIVTDKYRGLYSKFLIRLKRAEEKIPVASKKDYLPYAHAFENLCKNFSMRKEEILEVFFLLREIGLIEFVKFRGIKLNYEVRINKDGR